MSLVSRKMKSGIPILEEGKCWENENTIQREKKRGMKRKAASLKSSCFCSQLWSIKITRSKMVRK